jgi:hypothetical protein
MDSHHEAAAERLNDWFRSIVHSTGESLFSIMPEGLHRDAIVLDVLKRNARILVEAELDSQGKLYSPMCFFLAAACRKVGTSLGVGHWRAALDNVVHLQHQLLSTRAESEMVGLEVGSPAVLFKQELGEAIRQAGLASGVSYLSKEDRQIALGLAINWGMRLLLAYALECCHTATVSDRKDLAWIADLMGSLLTSPANA